MSRHFRSRRFWLVPVLLSDVGSMMLLPGVSSIAEARHLSIASLGHWLHYYGRILRQLSI
jgi:hypothetical protein